MNELLLVAGIHLLGVASPGPDLALVLKNALSSGRSVGIYTALGIGAGIAVHVLYSILGLAVVISKSIVLFNIIKLVGAAYLIWIGLNALKSRRDDVSSGMEEFSMTISRTEAVKQGFLTNILNPKVTLFFLSLFTQVIDANTSNVLKMIYGVEMMIVTFVWFSLVAMFMTQKPIQKAYQRVKHLIDRIFGIVLITLGVRVAMSSR